MRSMLVGMLMLLGATSAYSTCNSASVRGDICQRTISIPSQQSTEFESYVYELYWNGNATAAQLPGTGGTISWNVSQGGTYTVKSLTCGVWMNGSFNMPEARVIASSCAGGPNIVQVWYTSATPTPTTFELYGTKSGFIGSQNGNGTTLSFSFTSVGPESFSIRVNGNCDAINTPSAIGQVLPIAPNYVVDACVPGLKLTNTTSGYSYSAFIDNVLAGAAFVDASGGVSVKATGPGNYSIRTSGNGCSITTDLGPMNIDGSQAPVIYNVSLSQGVDYTCDVTLTKKIKLSGSNTGVTYQLQNKGAPMQSPAAGTGSALEWTVQSSGGELFTVVATKTSSSCTAKMNGSVEIAYIAPPLPLSITGDVCLKTIDLSCIQPNTNYQLYLNGNPVAQSPVGTSNMYCSNSLRWTNLAPGNYTVKATSSVTQCATWMNGSFNIPANSVPSQYTLSGGGSGCGTSNFNIQLSGSQTGVSYTLINSDGYTEPPLAGNNSILTWTLTNQTATKTFTVLAKNTTTQCTQIMNGSATFTYNGPAPFTIKTELCSDLAVLLPCSESGVSYQLFSRGIAVGSAQPGTGSCSIPLSWPASPGGYYQVKAMRAGCTWTSDELSFPENAASLQPFTVDYGPICPNQARRIEVINPQNLVMYTLLDGDDRFWDFGPSIVVSLEEGTTYQRFKMKGQHTITGCSFTTPPFTVGTYRPFINNPGTSCTPTTISVTPAGSVEYQWYSDTNLQGNTRGTSLDIDAVGSHNYGVVVSQGTLMSCRAEVTTRIGFATTPTISANDATTFCEGGNVKLTASDGESWQWRKNNADIPGATMKDYTAVQTGKYSCLIKRYTCAVLSDSISVNVIPAPVPVVTGPTSGCAPAGVTLTASGGVSYQWFLNGTAVGTLANQNFTSSGSATVKATGANGCAKTSSPISLAVNPIPPKPNPVAGPASFCQGSYSTLSLPNNSSTYWWYRNGSFWANGYNLQVYDNASYTVKEQSIYNCYSPESNAYSFTVNPLPTTTISPASTVSFCSNEGTTLTASPSSGVTYQWLRNGTAAGSSQSLPINMAGSYTVTATYATGCAKTSSATVASTIAVPATPAITQTIQCSGGSATLTGNVTGSAYLWSNGATTLSIQVSTIGTYTLKVKNSNGCWSAAGSTTVSSLSAPNFALTTSGDLCTNGEATISVVNVVGAVQSRSWSPVTGTGASVQVYNQGTYTCTITFIGGCVVSKSIMVKRVPANCPMPLRMADPSLPTEASFYPNPADQEINIITPATPYDRKISLINIQGVVLQNVVLPSNSSTKRIPLHDLADGIYLLILESNLETERYKVQILRKQ